MNVAQSNGGLTASLDGGGTPSGGLGQFDWSDGMAVYYGTRGWAKFIAGGNKSQGKYWNVFDIYKNIEPSTLKEYWSLFGGMTGNISDRKTYNNGVEIFVTETRLMSHFPENNIEGIVVHEDILRISFYGTQNQSQGVININFNNKATFDDWYNYIFK